MIDTVSKDSPRKIARHAAALRPKSREPKESPLVKERILRLLRGGCTLTEICQRKEMPSYSTLCEWRTFDDQFATDVAEAMTFQSEYMIKESADMVRTEAEKDAPDHDRQRVMTAYADVALKYAAAISPRKFGALAKLGVDGECTPQLQIVTFAVAPIAGAPASEVVSARDAIQSKVQTTADGKAASTRSHSNGSNGRGTGSGKRSLQVQANRNTTRKAKRNKAQA